MDFNISDMTQEELQYYANYQSNLAKFIFTEARNLTVIQYTKLNDEIRDVKAYLKANEKFLNKVV